MGEIPAEIMQSGRDVANNHWLSTFEKNGLAKSIARAILAERQRCAEVARTHMVRHQGPDGSAWAAADKIAEEISSGINP